VSADELKINNYKALLSSANEYFEKVAEDRKKGMHLNPFWYFYINEPEYSLMLADLLDPKGSHGQGNLFLKEYLYNLNVDFKNEDFWIVQAEKGKIDIVLSAENPKRVVIIENKINNAPDMSSQLYRYYSIRIKKYYQGTEDNRRNFKVVYLTKDEDKKPSDQTMKSENGEEEVPQVLVLYQTFKKDIKDLLTKCKETLVEDNYRLRAYLEFFIEKSIAQ
jgi:hypothetical protein